MPTAIADADFLTMIFWIGFLSLFHFIDEDVGIKLLLSINLLQIFPNKHIDSLS